MSPEGWVLIFVVGIASALGPSSRHIDDGSLRSALEAVTRKQRSLDKNTQDYYNDLHSFKFRGDREREHDRDDELEFLPYENGQLETIGEGFQKTLPNGHWADEMPENSLNNKLLERALLDYLENTPAQDDTAPSAFRERERSGSHKRGVNSARPNVSNKQLAKFFLEELEDGPPSDQGEIEDEEYLDTLQALYDKYRTEQDTKAHGYDFLNAPMSWSDTFGKRETLKDPDQDLLYLVPTERRNVNARFPLGREYKEYRELRKRYPVAKRSPKPLHHKRQVTDPKVAQDLGNLFGKQSTDSHDHSHEHHDHTHSHDHDHDHEHGHEHTSEAPNTTTLPKGQKENATKDDRPREHTFEVKKKSIDFSPYFGIDRRKKKESLLARPGTQDQDDHWLLQQYYKTMAENLKPSERVANKEGSEKRDKLQQMDSRLKNIEDLIVEEALRYTGSRDGVDIQEVKDRVMERLAAAYSLEKMRRALKEFENNVAAQKQAQKLATTQNNLTTNFPNSATDDKRSDNSISSDEGVDEDMSCPEMEAIENRCKAVDILVGDRAQLLYPSCVMHQICRACMQDDEGCDKSFATEAAKACDGHVGCLRAAREAHITLSQLQIASGTPGLCSESPCLTRSAHYIGR